MIAFSQGMRERVFCNLQIAENSPIIILINFYISKTFLGTAPNTNHRKYIDTSCHLTNN